MLDIAAEPFWQVGEFVLMEDVALLEGAAAGLAHEGALAVGLAVGLADVEGEEPLAADVAEVLLVPVVGVHVLQQRSAVPVPHSALEALVVKWN